MEDGCLAHSYRARQCKAMTHKTGCQLFGGQPGNNIILNPIELLWCQMKQLQSVERATLAAELKKMLLKSRKDLANFPQIPPQKHAEVYGSGC